jgi:microcystin-dependent protein
MKKSFLIYLVGIMLLQLRVIPLVAQVGINTDNPHSSSILQIFSGNRGLLIPTMSKGDLISGPADGLLIYNSTSKMFDFYNKSRAKWQPISPFITDSVGYALSMTLTLNNILTLNSKVFLKDTLSELKGLGTIPIGGIIMWSGSKIPYGWALCDGHITPEGITTPDLRGRFIVGAGTNSTGLTDPSIWDADYLSSGNLSCKGIIKGKTGGNKSITLTNDQLPMHSHYMNIATSNAGEHVHPYITADADGNFSSYFRDGAKGVIMNHVGGYYVTYDSLTRQTRQIDLTRAITGNQMDAVPNHAHLVSGSTNNIGLSLPVENRPPYYVLAFIIRVK